MVALCTDIVEIRDRVGVIEQPVFENTKYKTRRQWK